MIEGVIRTRVGYAGGKMSHPNYSHMGDHTETVQVDFDPDRLTYAELLETFWNSHDPNDISWSRQYMNAIFYHDEEQQQAAMISKAKVEEKTKGRVRTELLPVRSFTLAEDYHQKYLLKQRPDLLKEMTRIYTNEKALVQSTAAARLNGYVGGYGSTAQFEREIDSLGLSPEGRRTLNSIISNQGFFK